MPNTFEGFFGESPDRMLDLYRALSNKPDASGPAEYLCVDNEGMDAHNYGHLVFKMGTTIVAVVTYAGHWNPNTPYLMFQQWMSALTSIVTEDAEELPGAECYVLYCGEDDRPEQELLRLSDANYKCDNLISTDRKPSLELIVKAYSIKMAHSPAILDRSKYLKAYIEFMIKIGTLN